MFCTGYIFKFPFLDADQLGLQIQEQVVSPLYRYLLPPAFPSLFFIGICKIICPFPNFNCQVSRRMDRQVEGSAPFISKLEPHSGMCKPSFSRLQVQFALAVMDGSVVLPSRAEMEDDVHRELQAKLSRGVEWRHLLVMDQDQWEYCRTLATAAGFPPLAPVVRGLYEEVARQRQIHPQNYRMRNYRLISETEWSAEHGEDGGENRVSTEAASVFV